MNAGATVTVGGKTATVLEVNGLETTVMYRNNRKAVVPSRDVVETIALPAERNPETVLREIVDEHRAAVEFLGYDEGDDVRLPKGKTTYTVTAIAGEVVTYREIGGRWTMVRIGAEAARYEKVVR